MIFYLVLRALDTIEDDMDFFPSHAAKINELEKFCSRALTDPGWECRGVGEADERTLLEDFKHVRSCFQALDEEVREREGERARARTIRHCYSFNDPQH